MNQYLSIEDYLANKTVKLSDAYSIEIKDREPFWDNNLTEVGFTDDDIQALGIEIGTDENRYKTRKFTFKNCTSFTPPTYTPKEMVLKFCNTTKVIYVPNTDNPSPVKFQFFENERRYIGKFIRYCLRKNFFDEDIDHSRDAYNPHRYIDSITVNVLDNNLQKVVLRHIFECCRINSYDYDYKFKYDSNQTLNPTIDFSFFRYKIDLNPNIEYEERRADAEKGITGYTERNNTQTDAYRNYRGVSR